MTVYVVHTEDCKFGPRVIKGFIKETDAKKFCEQMEEISLIENEAKRAKARREIDPEDPEPHIIFGYKYMTMEIVE